MTKRNILGAGSLVLLLLLFCLPRSTSAQSEEYILKTVFIEKFTRFIEWPAASKINDPSKPFILGVVGKNPIEASFAKIFSTNKIKEKKVELRHISNLKEISACHLLFIAKTSRKKLAKILSFTQNSPILTISDSAGFAERGVHINLFVRKGKIGFEINETACKDSGLTISYLMLRLARIVDPVRKGQK